MSAVITGDQNGTVGLINAGTAVASTSGTSIDFTGIPAGVKRVTVMMAGVSTNGSANYQIQIGAGSVTTSGYASSSTLSNGANNVGPTSTGFVSWNNNAANVYSGIYTICNMGSNLWVMSGVISMDNNVYTVSSAGRVTLGGTLDRVRFTTVGGTDTFDAGSINILYE